MPRCAVRENGGRGSSALGTARSSLRPSFSSIRPRNFSTPNFSSTYLSRALVRSVRSPWSMNTRTTASATSVASTGLTSTPVSPAKLRCPVNPPRQSRNQTPGFEAEAVLHLHGLETDVVGILQHRNDAATVEADVEFARQAVERAVVENVEVPFARIGARVDQLLRVDAGGRRAGDVADIVGAGAARAEPQVLHRLDHGDRILRFDFADLQIGARGDVGVAAAIALGEIGDAGKLRGLEDAVRHAQPAHIGVLVRRDVKQAEETPTEIVRRFRVFVLGGEALEPLVGIERMLVALELLRVGQLAAGLEHAVLCFQRGGIRPDRLAPRGRRPPPPVPQPSRQGLSPRGRSASRR